MTEAGQWSGVALALGAGLLALTVRARAIALVALLVSYGVLAGWQLSVLGLRGGVAWLVVGLITVTLLAAGGDPFAEGRQADGLASWRTLARELRSLTLDAWWAPDLAFRFSVGVVLTSAAIGVVVTGAVLPAAGLAYTLTGLLLLVNGLAGAALQAETDLLGMSLLMASGGFAVLASGMEPAIAVNALLAVTHVLTALAINHLSPLKTGSGESRA